MCHIVFIASAGIKGIPILASFMVVQMNRKEEQPARIGTVLDDFFRSVAMMGVHVDNGTPLTETLIGNGVHGTCCNAVEDTEPTRLSALEQASDTGVMAWGTHYTKGVAVSSDQYTTMTRRMWGQDEGGCVCV